MYTPPYTLQCRKPGPWITRRALSIGDDKRKRLSSLIDKALRARLRVMGSGLYIGRIWNEFVKVST